MRILEKKLKSLSKGMFFGYHLCPPSTGNTTVARTDLTSMGVNTMPADALPGRFSYYVGQYICADQNGSIFQAQVSFRVDFQSLRYPKG